MLSIIISSYNEDYFNQLSINIKETIGENFEYEIIQQWNPGTMGICQAYNIGGDQAKYDNLLFIHEDIIFEVNNWGKILIDYLKIDNIGCVGIAGSSTKTKFPIGWWDMRNSIFLNLNQITESRGVESYRIENDQEVKILDGVFIAVKKVIWKNNKFNINNNSFHGYDIEFSLKISQLYTNIVTNKILVTHFSEGKLKKDWFLRLIKIYSENNYHNIKTTSKEVKYFINYLNVFSFSRKEKFNIFFKFYNPFNFNTLENLRILKYFIHSEMNKK